MLVPLVYLALRAFSAEVPVLAEMLLRRRTLVLMRNTLLLAGGVTLFSLAISLPLALLTERTNIIGRRLITIAGVVPLAVPGYVMAYALLGIGGNYGFAARVLGLEVSRISGFTGALLALTLYSFPYMYLNLRTGLHSLDPGLEESARSLGYRPAAVLLRVVLPHLRPAVLAGSVIIILYTVGDFGAVALMRYEVFSYAIYNQYANAFDRVYVSVLSLILLAIPAVILTAEARLLSRTRLARVGTGAARRRVRTRLSPLGQALGLGYATLVAAVSIGLPVVMLLFWMLQSPPTAELARVWQTFLRSAAAAGPAAVLATLAALPIAYMHSRYPGRLSRAAEKAAYIGYAVPPLSLALALVFFSLRATPVLYQRLPLLIIAYSMNFLALALGPLRSALLHAPRKLEEAARSFGYTPRAAFLRAILPLLRTGMLASLVLVFVMAMKELPLALILGPTGWTTLSMAVFTRTSEALMAQAAPYAAAIVLFSSLFVGLMLRYEGDDHAPA
ncbi:ABC transporter permease [Spirochaeta africana]|uniref:ABC-type Fe3+ transport system, permease component n=1 Tax=Spirochaeta africana (strain ATCC 700263 / DSM 8902 / Z-7692) TaxID=889378 RepID=H9ULK2_SPIAZ|nr:iron ABC transporter permease [Spirochaeta africana]AFG38395.1 ABC-type Fe3+ transport system, permease component [Spirochaeta africana DSM 8902]